MGKERDYELSKHPGVLEACLLSLPGTSSIRRLLAATQVIYWELFQWWMRGQLF